MLTSTVGIVHLYCRIRHSLSYLRKMRNTVYNLLLTAWLRENSLYSFPEKLHCSYSITGNFGFVMKNHFFQKYLVSVNANPLLKTCPGMDLCKYFASAFLIGLLNRNPSYSTLSSIAHNFNSI